MNLSGESIQEIINFYKIENEKIIIVYDDIDTKLGTIKIRKKGGPGTHNGMKSVIKSINTQEFARIKVGIGQPEDKSDLIYYVIGPIPEKEKEQLEIATSNAKDAIVEILKNGVDIAMNKYN